MTLDDLQRALESRGATTCTIGTSPKRRGWWLHAYARGRRLEATGADIPAAAIAWCKAWLPVVALAEGLAALAYPPSATAVGRRRLRKAIGG